MIGNSMEEKRNPAGFQVTVYVQDDRNLSQLTRDLYRDLKRPPQFQRLDSAAASKPSILKPLARVSQLNLSRLSAYCSYSMFNNESTESLESGAASPASVRLSLSSQRLNQVAKIRPRQYL